MADDRYNWLDKDTAERLLRGEQVSARHGDGARELEQLLQAASAVGAKTPGTTPGPGATAPAPTPSATTTDPGHAVPSTTATP